MEHDVVVVGGGPAGLYTALHIRRLDVLVLEEHSQVGLPRHCAGIIGSWTAEQVSRLSKRLITASYRTLKFLTPSGIYEVSSKTPIAYHVERPELENILASYVESLGHKIVTGQKAKPSVGLRVKAMGRDLKYGTLVVAEGPLSKFRDVLVEGRPTHIYGLQVVARTASPVDDSTIHIHYDSLNPDFFGWVIPLDATTVKAGFASRRPVFSYIERIAKQTGIELTSMLDRFGGPLPLSKPPKTPVFYSKVVLHGDSVPLVKPYTGGGLFWIFKLSPVLAEHVERGALVEYDRYYRSVFYLRTAIERLVVGALRKTRYHIPVKFVHSLSNLNLLGPGDFDNHMLVAIKSLIALPVALFL